MNDLLTPVRVPAAQQNGQTPERPLTLPPDGQPFAPEKGRRRSSDMFDEAESISSLVGSSGLTQEKIAERLSVSQSYVANKLRLLRFTGEEREIIRASGLTERHARAALRLSDRSRRISALREMIKRKMNVASAEEFVETLLCSGDPLPIPPEEPHSAGRPGTGKFETEFKRRLLLRDMRIFYNSIDHAVESVRSCGFDVSSSRVRTDGGVVITITVRNASK